MKIQSAQFQMQAAHAEQRQRRVEEQLRVSVSRPAAPPPPPAPAGTATTASASAEGGDAELLYYELLIELIAGRDVEIARIDAPAAEAGGSSAPPAQAGLSAERRSTEHYSETELSSFAASGTVQTSDGRQARIELSLLMQRSFESSTTVTVTVGERKDPLLLNLAGNAPELSTARYAFDLDDDGATENVSLATGSSAFLALDRNGDGRIGDGSELFGALSGDGFAELARHDGDGNGFIDAGDAVYARLRAWSKDASGSDVLTPLASLGIGALYLGSVETPFAINTVSNETLGVVRRSGLWIGEDFSSGTLQQLDLVV